MKSKLLLIVISSITSLFPFATHAQDLFVNYEPVKLELFQKILSTNTIGNYPILPIGGNWQFMHSRKYESTGVATPVNLGELFAIDIRENKMYADIKMNVNLNQGNMGDWTDEPCKRDNFLYKRSVGGKFTNVNCATINHVVGYYVEPTGVFQQLVVKLSNNGTELTPTVIRVTFTRYTNSGRRLVYEININPENFGIARDSTKVWGSNSWHKEFLDTDPKKRGFINNLIKWVDATQDNIDAAFSKKQDAFVNLKSLAFYLNSADQPEPKEVPNKLSVEDRIKVAKGLFDKALITESQFNEQVKFILNQK
jgi:hypothetical protein